MHLHVFPEVEGTHSLFPQGLKKPGVLVVHQTVLARWVDQEQLPQALLTDVGHIRLGQDISPFLPHSQQQPKIKALSAAELSTFFRYFTVSKLIHGTVVELGHRINQDTLKR